MSVLLCGEGGDRRGERPPFVGEGVGEADAGIRGAVELAGPGLVGVPLAREGTPASRVVAAAGTACCVGRESLAARAARAASIRIPACAAAAGQASTTVPRRSSLQVRVERLVHVDHITVRHTPLSITHLCLTYPRPLGIAERTASRRGARLRRVTRRALGSKPCARGRGGAVAGAGRLARGDERRRRGFHGAEWGT